MTHDLRAVYGFETLTTSEIEAIIASGWDGEPLSAVEVCAILDRADLTTKGDLRLSI